MMSIHARGIVSMKNYDEKNCLPGVMPEYLTELGHKCHESEQQAYQQGQHPKQLQALE
jgi:hypothetical protein